MTIDEYANLERGNGTKLSKVDGIWWREVRPFFYRPLFPFVRIRAGAAKPPPASFCGGFQHLVSSPELSNSYMNFLVFDEVHNYSIDRLTHNYRKHIKKGLKYFVIKPVDNFQELITSGYQVYKSFHARTQYSWKSERTRQNYFTQWAQNLFHCPKLLILGAYSMSELSAISISYLVEDIVIYATFFSTTECLNLRVSEFMLHSIREMASQCYGAKYIFLGSLGSKRSLDDFKISRGCIVIAEPAYFRINPIILFLTKYFRNEDYKKLVGMNQEELDEMLQNRKGDNHLNESL